MDCCASREEKEQQSGVSARKQAKVELKKKQEEEVEQKKVEIADKVKSVGNRFVNSKRFKDWVKKSFQEVDIDKNEVLDANEVHIAVLLLYLKIAGVCKGAVPPDREDIEDLMKKFDVRGGNAKGPGTLDYEHFEQFCQFLCSQIAARVSLQMIMQMVLAPLLGLIICMQWEKFMMRIAPDLFKVCTSWVPTEVIVTLFVGIGISLFVPPMMNVVDKLILKEAHKVKDKSANKAA